MRIVLLLLALIVSASGARAAIHRDALWFVLRSCVVAQNTAGIPFPCLAVNLASSTGPGYAVLRAPFNPPRVLVVPVEKIEGIESPILQHPDARAYWQAALESRRFVADALGGRIPLTEVALAVNSSVGRSQDQLHSHLDCLKLSIRFALGYHASAFSARWTFLKFPLEGARYYGLKVGAAQAEVFNPARRTRAAGAGVRKAWRARATRGCGAA